MLSREQWDSVSNVGISKTSRLGAGPNHLNQYGPHFVPVLYFPGERDPASMDAVAGFQTHMKTQPVHGGHECFVRLLLALVKRYAQQRIGMVLIHVIEDSGRGAGQWNGRRAGVVLSAYPPHHAEATDEINAIHIKPVISEVGIVLPVSRALVIGEIEVTHFGRFHHMRVADQGEAGSSQRISCDVGLGDQQTGMRVLIQILGVHGHAADEENGPPESVHRKRHHRSKWETRKLARMGGEATDAPNGGERAGTLGERWLGYVGSRGTRASVLIHVPYFPTRWSKSFSFSSQTYSISSVSVKVNSRFTVHGLV